MAAPDAKKNPTSGRSFSGPSKVDQSERRVWSCGSNESTVFDYREDTFWFKYQYLWSQTRLISIVSKPIKLQLRLRLCLHCLDLNLTLSWPLLGLALASPWPCPDPSDSWHLSKMVPGTYFWSLITIKSETADIILIWTNVTWTNVASTQSQEPLFKILSKLVQ